ncbi:hypothetical protein PHLCEN_2v3607 [Hermanssonia centrifuga]|uniref:Uncharacterized protein n=1 Tax=Hermanssonia centrifuga TaxID=98765 RepID=A0A2R6QEJ3_9APHY|nr:hypothetical protein PHLCEN_2v3607 [Hermanssonia centrifuga]
MDQETKDCLLKATDEDKFMLLWLICFDNKPNAKYLKQLSTILREKPADEVLRCVETNGFDFDGFYKYLEEGKRAWTGHLNARLLSLADISSKQTPLPEKSDRQSTSQPQQSNTREGAPSSPMKVDSNVGHGTGSKRSSPVKATHPLDHGSPGRVPVSSPSSRHRRTPYYRQAPTMPTTRTPHYREAPTTPTKRRTTGGLRPVTPKYRIISSE